MINLKDDKYNVHVNKKARILKYVSEIDIFRKYCPYDFDMGKLFCSPLRKDNTPSFMIFYTALGGVLYKDFGNNEVGDCFTFIQNILKLHSFREILDLVERDMLLDSKTVLKPLVANTVIRESNLRKPLQIKSRKWVNKDLDYWSQFGITLKTLNLFRVVPVKFIFIGDKILTCDEHAYAYCEFKDNVVSYKIYQPFNKKYKWLNNHTKSVHQGYEQLPKKGNLLLITKSLKDVMSLHEVCAINSIAVQSESILIKDSVISEYLSRYDEIYTLFDNDEAGKKLAAEYKDIYDIPSLFIPEDTNQKDFSDLVKKIGDKKSKSILLNIMCNKKLKLNE